MQWQATSANRVTPGRTKATSAALGGLIALAAAIGIGRFVYTPILPPMMSDLGLSGSAAGLIASANYFGYLVGALVAGAPVLPGPRGHWLLGALVVGAITTACMGRTQTLALFLILRFIGGAASAFVLILASAAVLERLAEARRDGLSSLHFAGVGVGIALSAIMVAALMRAGQSWQSLWLASGALSLGVAPAVALFLRTPPGPPRSAGHQPSQSVDATLRRVIVAYGLFGFGYVITATFL